MKRKISLSLMPSILAVGTMISMVAMCSAYNVSSFDKVCRRRACEAKTE